MAKKVRTPKGLKARLNKKMKSAETRKHNEEKKKAIAKVRAYLAGHGAKPTDKEISML